jgi:hypothetical protein
MERSLTIDGETTLPISKEDIALACLGFQLKVKAYSMPNKQTVFF